MEYTAANLRDPLKSLLPGETVETSKAATTSDKSLAQPHSAQGPPRPNIAIQGILWGGPRPQVLIDGDLYTVGDTVKGAQIVAIDWHGLTVDVQGSLFQFDVTNTHLMENPGASPGSRSRLNQSSKRAR